MKVLISVALFLAATTANAYDVGVPFQSHAQDGTPYWVVICQQADECFEIAYQKCEGHYVGIDKQFYPMSGYRFYCAHPKKLVAKAP